MRGCHSNSYIECWMATKFILNSDCTTIQPIILVKNTVENVESTFLQTSDQSIFGQNCLNFAQ